MPRPLYEVIKDRIREDLLKTPEDAVRLPSERDLQERYGVSRPTISKALTALAGEGLLVRHSRRGNFAAKPNAEQRRRENNSPRQIGYVAPLAGEELIQRCFRGLDRIAHRRGYSVIMGNAGNSVMRERDAVRDLIATGVGGLIITPVPRRTAEVATDYLLCGDLGVPVVLTDTCRAEHGRIQVLFDNRRLGYAMTEWLIHEGHRQIALMTYVDDVLHPPLKARFEGYQDAVRDFGIVGNPEMIGHIDTNLPHEIAMSLYLDRLLSLPTPPTAIIMPEDTLALKMAGVLAARGVRVPEAMRVVGFDNRAAARYFDPPIPTSAPDFERLGETACGLLIEAMATGKVAPSTTLLDVPLLIRKPMSDLIQGNGATISHSQGQRV